MAMTAEELESTVLDLKGKIDGILETVSNAEKDFQYNKGLEEFKERNGATFDKYRDKLKKLNGDDFDLDKAAYDEYNNDFSDIEEATYVAQLVSEIDNKINKLKEALGEDDIEVHSNAEGETEVNSHDTEVESTSEENKEAAEEASEEDENKEEEEKPEDEKSDEDDDAEKEFIADLESEYDKYHKE